MASNQVEEILKGLLEGYDKSEPHDRARLGLSVHMIADHVLSFLVQLADKYQDYDAVRWLAAHADLSKCRVPQDWYQNIEDRLTKDPSKPKARREWNEVRSWVSKGKTGGRKAHSSPLATWVDRASKDVWWLLFTVREMRKDRENPCAIFNDDPKLAEESKWNDFLKGFGVPKETLESPIVRAAMFPFPERAIASCENDQAADAVISEVLLPLLKWLKRTKPDDWKADGFPGDLSELERRVRHTLGIKKAKAETRKNPVE